MTEINTGIQGHCSCCHSVCDAVYDDDDQAVMSKCCYGNVIHDGYVLDVDTAAVITGQMIKDEMLDRGDYQYQSKKEDFL